MVDNLTEIITTMEKGNVIQRTVIYTTPEQFITQLLMSSIIATILFFGTAFIIKVIIEKFIISIKK